MRINALPQVKISTEIVRCVVFFFAVSTLIELITAGEFDEWTNDWRDNRL